MSNRKHFRVASARFIFDIATENGQIVASDVMASRFVGKPLESLRSYLIGKSGFCTIEPTKTPAVETRKHKQAGLDLGEPDETREEYR